MSSNQPLLRLAKPLIVQMEDEIIHTVDFPVCADPDCICYQYEREQMQADHQPQYRGKTLFISSAPPAGIDAPLNGDRAFRLLK
ncbi:MAG TPA: hypothetical protein VKR06_31875 [Ktedonosporobacter sp.]|nr:hypothetical protein [Ktedonosporobacter sp.]